MKPPRAAAGRAGSEPRAALVLAAPLAAGCAPLQPPVQPAVVVVPAVPAPVTARERELLSQFARSALYEIEVSRLAAARATGPRVRSYAQALVSHRVQSWQQLGALMRARGMHVPTRVQGAAATKLQRLAAVPPSADFDAAYVRVVGVEDHADTIELLERTRLETRDPQLAAWIDRSMPVLRGDLQAARQLLAQPAG
jgi:putative membrane protein